MSETDHLQASPSGRGVDSFLSIPSTYYGAEIRVQESSSAEGPHVWIFVKSPENLNKPDGPRVEVSLHLTVEAAWCLAEQLATLVRDHYQGDARPSERVIDFISG